MKKLLMILWIALLPIAMLAQTPGQMKMPNGKISGKLVDESGKPVEFASVILMKSILDSSTKQNKDVMITGATTGSNGDFSFSEVPITLKLKLKISSIGFKNTEIPVAFERPKMDGMVPGKMPDPETIAKFMAALNKDLGKVQVASDATELSAVNITAAKALLELDIDKKTFNVEKNIVSAGGTAVDVMRNIPSIQVDIDGNVKLRNAAPTLFIDSRPTTLTLDQIPADAIEKVEVITNPSAKYDASGSMAGILNIVLKKNKKSGYNGMLNIGADKLGGSNSMGSFSLRQGKYNLTLMGMNMRMRNSTEGSSSRQSEIDGINASVIQDIFSKTKGMMSFARVSFDYNITSKTALTIGGMIGDGKFRPTEEISIENTINTVVSNSIRLSNSERNFSPKGIQLGFKHSFNTSGEELTADVNIFGGTNSGLGTYNTNYLTSAGLVSGTQIQKNMSNGANKFVTIQTDYVRPLLNGSFETGLRAQINQLENTNNNTLKAANSEVFKNIASASTNYASTNTVYAAYLSVSGKLKNVLSYKLGLRGESSAYNGELLNTGDIFKNSYPISLFPSVFLSKSISKTDQIQLSATRRVNRPNFFQLIPFIDYSDSLNITKGNANLVPEFTTSTELSYSKAQGTGTFLASAYYKLTNNLITRYLDQTLNPVTGKTDLINSYINANSSQNYGTELTYTNKLKKWWDFTSNINFYNSKIDIENIENATGQADLWTVFGKINNNFNLPNKWVVQLSGDYQGKTNLPVSQGQGFGPQSQAQSTSQGYIEPFYGVDIAVKKTFLPKDVASLTLSVNDIFKTRTNVQVSNGQGFTQTYTRLTNPQMIKLNFSFRFGQMDMNMFKKNNNSSSQEGMQMQ